MGLQQCMEADSVSSLPLRDAIVVHRYTVIRAAIALMRDQGQGCAVITDRCSVPQGIFTEQSVVQLLVQGACLDTNPVCDFCDPRFVCVREDELISSVWHAIHQDGVRFVCVVGESGKLTGVVGQKEMSKHLARVSATNA